MKTTNNTVLITGGSAGIGFETAKQLSALGNHVIITGRNKEKLEKAASQLHNVTAIVCDVTNDADVAALIIRIQKDFPQLNIIMNNAGNAFVYKFGNGADTYTNTKQEMETNLFAPIKLIDNLFPILSQQSEAAIINVSSILALVPSVTLPTYSASKAALHSYTQILRYSVANTSVKVFELMPPLVNTEFSKEIGGANGIPPQQVAEDLVKALASNTYEIHVGMTAQIYALVGKSPEEALNTLNASRG